MKEKKKIFFFFSTSHGFNESILSNVIMNFLLIQFRTTKKKNVIGITPNKISHEK
jgi:hypothetical protein